MSGNTFGGRVAFVTGGGSGIGRATSIRIAKGGGLVAVVDRNLDGAKATVDLIGLAGGQAIAIEADGIVLARDEAEALRQRLAREDLTVLAYRFAGDRFCTAARFEIGRAHV